MNHMIASSPTVSVIVPVGARQMTPDVFFAEHRPGLEALGVPYEVIFVLAGPQVEFERGLERAARAGEQFSAVSLTRSFGEATSLMVGFERAKGEIIVTLPAYPQVAGSEVGRLVRALDGADIAIGYRLPRAGGVIEAARRKMFHGILALVTRVRFHDLGCNVRALKRKVLEEIRLYGDQQRFLPVLAERQGFRVAEITLQQSVLDRRGTAYAPRTYTRGFLDIFSVFFLVRFTKKPLRFFGMIGVGMFALGLACLLYLLIERFYFGQPLADRPALLLTSLLIVMGVQVFALGLLGELIIFVHAGGSKDYKVDRVIEFEPAHTKVD